MASRKKKEGTVRHCSAEKYEIIEINRQELKNAPYNPRSISAKAKKKLKKTLTMWGCWPR